MSCRPHDDEGYRDAAATGAALRQVSLTSIAIAPKERPTTDSPSCVVVRPGERYDGKQGLTYVEGISAERVGSTGICMHLLTIPPGGRAEAHLHEAHETAIYVIGGEAEMWHGEGLAEHLVVKAGEMLYIPANTPHLPVNTSDAPCVAVLARTDPHEQESVVLLPDLEAAVPR